MCKTGAPFRIPDRSLVEVLTDDDGRRAQTEQWLFDVCNAGLVIKRG